MTGLVSDVYERSLPIVRQRGDRAPKGVGSSPGKASAIEHSRQGLRAVRLVPLALSRATLRALSALVRGGEHEASTSHLLSALAQPLHQPRGEREHPARGLRLRPAHENAA